MVVLIKEVVVERIVGMVVKGGGRVCCRESKCRNTSGKAGSRVGKRGKRKEVGMEVSVVVVVKVVVELTVEMALKGGSMSGYKIPPQTRFWS